MKKLLTIASIVVLCGSSSACTQTDESTARYGVTGAVLGALAGAAITGKGEGALTGAAIGGASGAFVGERQNRVGLEKRQQRYCVYRDYRGVPYRAPCN